MFNYNEILLEVYIKCRIFILISGEYGKIDVIVMGIRWILSIFFKFFIFLGLGIFIFMIFILEEFLERGFFFFFFNGDKSYVLSLFLFIFNLV